MIYGDPQLPSRYWKKVQVRDDGCWEWVGAMLNSGYGCARVEQKTISVHRWMCIVVHGSPTEDKPFALHSCDNRACVNPEHLRWGTATDNLNDSWDRSTMRESRKRTHCPKGHEYSHENTYVNPKGVRTCRICYRAHWRAWNERKKGVSSGA